MTETVWVFSKTPCQRNEPSPTSVFTNEEAARKTARAWREGGWNVEVDEMQLRSDITAATEGMEERYNE